jgi:hypothetical protein
MTNVDKQAGTAAVLDEMVAGIMGVKATKGAKLTPVGMEGVPFTPKQNQFSVLESPYDGLEAACRRIREGMEMLDKYVSALERDAKSINENRSKPATRIPDALDEAWAKPEEPILPNYADLQAEAQASLSDVLAGMPDKGAAGGVPASTWTCPTHGDTDVQEHKSPKGRVFNACHVDGCKEFQKR